MSRFRFEQLVAIVQREVRDREREERPGAAATLLDDLAALQALPREAAARRGWDPMPRIKTMIKAIGKPVLRWIGLYEPVRAWVKSR